MPTSARTGQPVAAFLDDLRAVCVWVRVMGCYPRCVEPAI